jgi:hypothetical protein
MRFFVPSAKDDRQADFIWNATRAAAARAIGREVGETRIFSLTYERAGKLYRAQVGERDPRVFEPVVAILEANGYLVCTSNHGVVRGQPIQVAVNEVREIEYFDE